MLKIISMVSPCASVLSFTSGLFIPLKVALTKTPASVTLLNKFNLYLLQGCSNWEEFLLLCWPCIPWSIRWRRCAWQINKYTVTYCHWWLTCCRLSRTGLESKFPWGNHLGQMVISIHSADFPSRTAHVDKQKNNEQLKLRCLISYTQIHFRHIVGE